MLTASAQTGRHVARLLDRGAGARRPHGGRIPTAELNRFLAERVAGAPAADRARAAAAGQHRLKLLYMTQTGERPPRFAIQVNSRARVTRDYAYFLENRMRERYGMEACRW